MNATETDKPLPKSLLIIVALTIISLFVILVVAATISDDIPNHLPPAGKTSTGD